MQTLEQHIGLQELSLTEMIDIDGGAPSKTSALAYDIMYGISYTIGKIGDYFWENWHEM